jgi:hypothetical protein
MGARSSTRRPVRPIDGASALRDELEEAAAYGDLGRTDRLRAETEFLTEQLASAMGIGGAARRVGGPSERARSAVTQNIRSTLKRLVQALPVLDEPLARRIRTGAFCAYEPDPGARSPGSSSGYSRRRVERRDDVWREGEWSSRWRWRADAAASTLGRAASW